MGLSEVFWAARAHCGRAGVPGGTGGLAAAPLAPTFQAVTFPLQQSYHQPQLQPPVLSPLALLCFASIHSPLPLFLTFPIHRIRHKQRDWRSPGNGRGNGPQVPSGPHLDKLSCMGRAKLLVWSRLSPAHTLVNDVGGGEKLGETPPLSGGHATLFF